MTQEVGRNINAPAYIAELGYRCYGCQSAEGLYWYRGTSMPLCRAEACRAKADAEWAADGLSLDEALRDWSSEGESS